MYYRVEVDALKVDWDLVGRCGFDLLPRHCATGDQFGDQIGVPFFCVAVGLVVVVNVESGVAVEFVFAHCKGTKKMPFFDVQRKR